MPMPFTPCDPSLATCADVSVNTLQYIFGEIIGVLVRGEDPNNALASNNLLATMFTFFNSGILIVASIIISYTAVIGTINTASDGETMGKSWSTVWTPLRIVAGGAMLLPSASGYSFIQMFVFLISLWAVGFANGTYKLGMTMGIIKPDAIVETSTKVDDYAGMRDFAKNYLAVSYCAKSANALYSDSTGNVDVKADNTPDKKIVNGTRTAYTFDVKDRNTETNLAGGNPVCGTVTLIKYELASSYDEDTGTAQALDSLRVNMMTHKLQAANSLMVKIDEWVATLPSDITQEGWDTVYSSKLNDIVQNVEATTVTNMANSIASADPEINAGGTAFIDSITEEGWVMAGGWYQRVGLLRNKLSKIVNEPVGEVSLPTYTGLPPGPRGDTLKNSVATVMTTISKKSEKEGTGYSDSKVNAQDIYSEISFSAEDMNVTQLSTDMGVKVSLFVNSWTKEITDTILGTGTDVDAVSRIKMTGDLLASYKTILEGLNFGAKTALTVVRMVTGAAASVQVLGNRVDATKISDPLWQWYINAVAPLFAEMISYLTKLAFYMSVVLPSLPYAIFMVTVVGWILAVFQTVIASPLWALMHMRPSQSFVGSDQQGYLLILALFVRPVLAILGLFAAMLIINPVVDFISIAFFAMKGDVMASTGLIGAVATFTTFIWWLVVYGGLLLPVMYMIYGLPQILPDHVLKWINAGVHDLGATGAAAEMKASTHRHADEAVGKKIAGDAARKERLEAASQQQRRKSNTYNRPITNDQGVQPRSSQPPLLLR